MEQAILSPAREKELHRLSEKLEVQFSNLELLNQALTHTSFANEERRTIPHNERLEFLGDAVLELASSTYLYEHFPDMPEGELTRTRASVVCSETLARLADGLGLGDYLLLGHGEEMSGGRTRQTNLEDVFEAVIGAIYLDQGWEAAREYVMRELAPAFHLAKRGEAFRDYKTMLQEYVFRKGNQRIGYELVAEDGPDHAKSFTFCVRVTGEVLGTGTGRSKKEAEQRAAQQALETLEARSK